MYELGKCLGGQLWIHGQQRTIGTRGSNETVKELALQTTQNTKDIAALQARDGEKAKSIAELNGNMNAVMQRLEKFEGGSVGRTTSFVPPPVRRPAISSDADDVGRLPHNYLVQTDQVHQTNHQSLLGMGKKWVTDIAMVVSNVLL